MKKLHRIIGMVTILPATAVILYLAFYLAMMIFSEEEVDFGPSPKTIGFLLIFPALAIIELWRLLYKDEPLSGMRIGEKIYSTIVGLPVLFIGTGYIFLLLFAEIEALVIAGVIVFPPVFFGAWCIYEIWLNKRLQPTSG